MDLGFTCCARCRLGCREGIVEVVSTYSIGQGNLGRARQPKLLRDVWRDAELGQFANIKLRDNGEIDTSELDHV